MQKLLLFLSVAAILTGVAGCKSGAPSIETIAKELCACLQPMVAMYDQMGAQVAEDEDAFMEMMEAFERTAGESQECSDALTQKYGDLADRHQEIEAAMTKTCPDVMQLLDEFGE
ncbi:MAG TPA: hypothetical protein PKC76_11110 [Saprospiraceae bacterium]|nr:hypothetical protein [Saprospiraceae bacterium]HMP24675.1 hypothetical protein [Saprospiraceae bacterium]